MACSLCFPRSPFRRDLTPASTEPCTTFMSSPQSLSQSPSRWGTPALSAERKTRWRLERWNLCGAEMRTQVPVSRAARRSAALIAGFGENPSWLLTAVLGFRFLHWYFSESCLRTTSESAGIVLKTKILETLCDLFNQNVCNRSPGICTLKTITSSQVVLMHA